MQLLCLNLAAAIWEVTSGEKGQGKELELCHVIHRIENFYGCPYDFIEIFDGPQSESFSLGRFCSETIPIFTSSSSHMSVVFHSDDIVTNIGFYASYESLLQDEKDTGRSFLHFSHQPCLITALNSDGWKFSQLGGRDLRVLPKLLVTYSPWDVGWRGLLPSILLWT